MHSVPVGSEVSTYKHLRSVEQQTHRTPPVLQEFLDLEVPTPYLYLLSHMSDFYNGDQFSYTEFEAWQKFAGVKLEYWERRVIRDLYDAKLTFDTERMKAQAEYDRLQNNNTK